MLNLKSIVRRILEDYALPWQGTHGVGHWARVLENGLRLAKGMDANTEVVQLFAVFHDSRRINEGTDHGHGRRGAELAVELRGDLFDIPDDEFNLLYEACAHHTDGGTDGDINVRVCWDADRLDLGRVGMYPDGEKLCTAVAKQTSIIKWADGRAVVEVVPELVESDWGITLRGRRS